MATTNAYVGLVVYKVYINEVLYNNKPYIMDCELEQTFGMHDLFFIRLEYNRAFAKLNELSMWPDDVPIRVVWGRLPNLNTWYGYVNHHENHSVSSSGSNVQQVEYVCIGTSMPMNVDKTRVWENVSPTYIAKKIASDHGLRAVVTPLKGITTNEMQSQESDFILLNRLADKFGMRFFVSGGTLYFVDPAIALFGNSASQVPTYYHDKFLTNQDSIRSYHKKSGLNMPGGVQANRVLHGLDHNTGQLFKSVAVVDPKRIRYKKDFSVTSYLEGKHKVDAEANIEQFFVGAQAQLFGDVLLYPGKLVNLQGSSMPGQMVGKWLVTSAKHRMLQSGTTVAQQDKYLTDVELVRNTESGTIMLKAQQPVIPEIVSMVLVNNIWVSTNQSVISESV